MQQQHLQDNSIRRERRTKPVATNRNGDTHNSLSSPKKPPWMSKNANKRFMKLLEQQKLEQQQLEQQQQRQQQQQQPEQEPEQEQQRQQQRKSNPQNAVLNQASVLADAFVPHAWRAVHLHPVTAPLTADALPSLTDLLKTTLHDSLVPAVPKCCCCPPSSSHAATISPPNVIRVEPELRFSLTNQYHPSINDSNGVNPRHVDSISDKMDYGQVFDTLLLLERHEILRLYERYSQYNIHIKATPSMYPEPISHNNNDPSHHHHRQDNRGSATTTTTTKPPPTLSTGIFTVKGLVDAQPALKIGDIVLLRPLHPIDFPVHYPHPNQGWNQYPPHHYQRSNVEIYANIRQLIRGAPAMATTTTNAPATLSYQRQPQQKHDRPMDQIITTWLNVQNHHMLQNFYGNQAFHVRFVPSTKFYERCKTAVQWITTLPPNMFTELLFPNRAPTIMMRSSSSSSSSSEEDMLLSSALQLEKQQLNDSQISFVYMVMKRTLHPSMDIIRPPMVLTGPAGTGKTKTLLAAIWQVLQLNNNNHHTMPAHQHQAKSRYRILVCTPSHTAADVVTLRLAELLDPTRLFRLYDSDRPVETVPIQILRFACQSVETGAFSMPSGPELLQYSVIVCTCSDAHLLYQAGCTNELLRVRRRCFQQYLQVTLRQCQLIGGDDGEPLLLQSVDQPHFTHLFVDEAAQATEPEILIPFSVVIDPLLGSPKVEIGLVGDPRQLSPNVFSNAAAGAGFGRSLLERLLLRPVHCLGGGGPDMLGNEPRQMEEFILYSLHDQLSVFLTLNYRGHPAFLMMPSALFYFDRLRSDKGVESPTSSHWCDVLRHVEELSSLVDISDLPDTIRPHPKQWQWPVHFRGVVGKDVSITIDSSFVGTNSWSNPAEARVVVDIVTALTQQGVSSASIGVMAPFRGQVVTIRKLLRHINLGRINVGTVEDFQAVERDVMILSLTRSTHSFVEHDIGQRMGIFGHSKRSNVALTRAEHLFCVVGNPHIMAKDPTWRQWLLFCLRNGFWYGEGVPHEELMLEHTAATKTTPSTSGFRQPGVVISTMENICREVVEG